jgi:putative spermidine/putrescine transport system substrate-binding protein
MRDQPQVTTEALGSTTRRRFLKGTASVGVGAAAAKLPLFNINHAWSQDVTYDGGVFDAGGAVFRLAEWGGFWEELQRKLLLDQFEKDFNCRIEYDSSFPWFPKYVAGGPENPAYDGTNWNLPEMFKTARAGDYFLSQDEIKANVPNAADMWPFAFDNGVGVTWAFGRYCYVYREDLVDPAPVGFKSFWEDRFAGQRATYITSNTLFMAFFMTANAVFGADQYDMEAGFQAMRDAMPMKISDFTGNMQTLAARGEILIGVQVDGEVYMNINDGIPVAPMLWEEMKPILTQTQTISRYSEPIQKKLAFALLNRRLSPEFMAKFDEEFQLRPTNSKVVVPESLAAKGVENTADAIEGLWIPDWNWWLDNEDEIVETVNEIFAG